MNDWKYNFSGAPLSCCSVLAATLTGRVSCATTQWSLIGAVDMEDSLTRGEGWLGETHCKIMARHNFPTTSNCKCSPYFDCRDNIQKRFFFQRSEPRWALCPEREQAAPWRRYSPHSGLTAGRGECQDWKDGVLFSAKMHNQFYIKDHLKQAS